MLIARKDIRESRRGTTHRAARRRHLLRSRPRRTAHRADYPTTRERQTAAATDVTGQTRSWKARLGDDLAPVAGFLAGKAGRLHRTWRIARRARRGCAALAVARTWLQVGAGLLVICFGLAQLGVPGFRAIVVQPPASWMRVVRKRARSQAALAPAALGVATVLLPCGVTLSVEALALASGSPWQGAAIMAVFILGTSPLFAVLGYAARKAATLWRGRLVAATGIAVVAMGLFTLNGGLELAGSPLAASRIVEAFAGTATADASATTVADGHQQVVVTATETGYSPHLAQIRAGIPTTFGCAFNRRGWMRSRLCDRRQPNHTSRIRDTPIDLGIPKPGTMHYACAMGMYTGTITVT